MKRKNANILMIIAMLLIITVSLTACSGNNSTDNGEGSKSKVIKLSIGAGHQKAGMSYVVAADDFFLPEISRRVKENTDYEIKWTTAYAGSVAQLSEIFEAVEAGTLDFGLLGFPFEPTKLFLHNVGYFVPFGNPDPVQANKITWQLFNEFPDFQEVFDEANQKLLCIAPTGNYTLNATFPMQTLKDLEGRKIGSAGPNLRWLEGTGAVPVQASLNDCYTSYTTGLFEGYTAYCSPVYGFKLYEVAPYQINLNFGALSINGISVNKDTWNKLPEEVREIILEVSEEYVQVSAEITAKMEKEALDAMIEKGYKVIDLPYEEMVKYINSLPEIPNENAKKLNEMGYPGTEIISRYIELIKESGHTIPREWVIE